MRPARGGVTRTGEQSYGLTWPLEEQSELWPPANGFPYPRAMAIPNSQPRLEIPLDVATGLAKGLLTQRGSIVRWAAGAAEGRGGRIYAHLPETRFDKPVEAVAKRATKLSPKMYVPVLIVGGAGAAVLGWAAKQRGAQRRYAGSVILAFEASLRAYVAAAQAGALDGAIIDRLVGDLDALQALSTGGGKVEISLDALVPLFDLVIAHTAELAEAYNFDLDDVGAEGGVVISLRRHLEAQKSILDEVS